MGIFLICPLYSFNPFIYSSDSILNVETVNSENKNTSVHDIFRKDQKKRKIRLKFYPEWEISPTFVAPLGLLHQTFPYGIGLNTQVNLALPWKFLPLQDHFLYRLGIKSGFHYYRHDEDLYFASMIMAPIHLEGIIEFNDLKIYPKEKKRKYTQWDKPRPLFVPYMKIFLGTNWMKINRKEKTGYYADYSRSVSSFDPIIGAGLGFKYSLSKRSSLKLETNGWLQFQKITGSFASIEVSGVFHY